MAIAKIVYKESANATPVTWMDVTQKTVTAGSMLNGTTALKNDGTDITGNIANKSSSDLTSNNLTVTAPAGYYASAATKTLSDQNLSAGNIKKDVTIFNVTGTYEGSGGGGDTYTLTTIVPQQTVSGSMPTLTHNGWLADGEFYLVTIDGTEYTCTAELQWGQAPVIGDMAWYYGTPSEYNYPFAVGCEIGVGMDCVIPGSGSHTIQVDHLEFVDGPLNLITKSITANGTYNASSDSADGYSSVTVNVSGGGSDWTLVYTTEITANVTSTSATTLSNTIQCDPTDLNGNRFVCVQIIDKAGKRNGYFYETMNFFNWIYDSYTDTYSDGGYSGRVLYRVSSSGTVQTYFSSASTGYGVYCSGIDDTGAMVVRGRYSSTYSLTIDGTYTINVYTLKWPNDTSPYST